MLHKKLRASVVALAAAGLAAGALTQAPVAQATTTSSKTIVIDQNRFETDGVPAGANWTKADRIQQGRSDLTGRVEIVAAPAGSPTPIHNGALRFVANDGEMAMAFTNALNGAVLANVSDISYMTYVDPDSKSGQQQVSLKISTDAGATLVYEPYLGAGKFKSAEKGVWLTWHTTDQHDGGWWLSDGSALEGPCNMNATCTYTNALAALGNPTARVRQLQLGAGTGWPNFDGQADKLSYVLKTDRKTFDFETNALDADTVTRIDDLDGPWTAEGAGDWNAELVAASKNGQSGAGVLAFGKSGTGSIVGVQLADYTNTGIPQFLGDIDNILLSSFRETNNDYPSVRFEGRLQNGEFVSITNTAPYARTNPAFEKASLIHDGDAVDHATWWLRTSHGSLAAGQGYTWAELMAGGLDETYVQLTRIRVGGSNATFSGGVDTLSFQYRDGSSQTWDFEAPNTYDENTTTDIRASFTGTPTVDADGNIDDIVFNVRERTATTRPDGSVKATFENLEGREVQFSYRFRTPTGRTALTPLDCGGTVYTDVDGNATCSASAGARDDEAYSTNFVEIIAVDAGYDGVFGTSDDVRRGTDAQYSGASPESIGGRLG